MPLDAAESADPPAQTDWESHPDPPASTEPRRRHRPGTHPRALPDRPPTNTTAAPSSPSPRRYLVEEQPRPPRRPRTPWMITTPEGRRFPRLSATEADRTIRGAHPAGDHRMAAPHPDRDHRRASSMPTPLGGTNTNDGPNRKDRPMSRRTRRAAGFKPARRVKVAGVSHDGRQEILARLIKASAGDSSLTTKKGRALRNDRRLQPEPDNPHDPEAVAVIIGGQKVGYLPVHRRTIPADPAATPFVYRITGETPCPPTCIADCASHDYTGPAHGVAIWWPLDTPLRTRRKSADR